MRDILVTLFVFASIPFILKRPFIGILMWTLLGFMNPHRLTWGFAYSLPFAESIAIATMLGMIASKEKLRFPVTRETNTMFIWLAWMFITTTMAYYQDLAWGQMDKVWKIMFMNFILIALMYSKERIIMLVWVIVVSLGLYGVKGGIFTITTGGAHRVMGPGDSFIGGNNEIGLALIMVVPLMRFLHLATPHKAAKILLPIAIGLTLLSVIGTHSRGALVGMVPMLAFLWWKSRNKFGLTVFLLLVMPLAINFMPPEWLERMHTIKTYEDDGSAQGRINAWWFAFNMANANFFGGGFESFRGSLFNLYAPNPLDVHDAHSIWFEVLGEQGYVGLGLFLTLFIFTWRSAQWTKKQARKKEDQYWAADLMGMIQVSLVGYALAGTFLGLAYFDFFYVLIAIVILTRRIVTEEMEVATGRLPKQRRRDITGFAH